MTDGGAASVLEGLDALLGRAEELYTDLHAALCSGKPQVITPQSVRRRVDILERCAAVAPVVR